MSSISPNGELVMLLRTTATRLILVLLILFLLVFVYVHYEARVTDLENNKRNLEDLVVRMQVQELESRKTSENKESRPREDLVVIYNRVPKTASTSFMGVAYDLCKQNGFHVLHINVTGNMHVLTLANQAKFVQNVTHWDAMKPALYHGHMAYVEFSRFGVSQRPIYINLIRKPLDRLVSYYYFLRFGDDFRPHLVRRKHGDKMSFDDCVELHQPDCDPDNMWLQIPFFCGHAAGCWEVGNKWALAEAKNNLLKHYMLVGITEELPDFISLLESTLPQFFRGALAHYQNSNKSHLRKTTQKVEPSPETISIIKKSKVWQMENEFYEFAVEQFHFSKRRAGVPAINNGPNAGVKDKTSDKALQQAAVQQQFTYEKIRPK
ncbi:heparin sulfate O-sulfotransferase isoform X1 [Hetaerina americana]|uniref:heparin sulfate O-sulfotransferase isoform X1 n=1 Tax=Hetaerina americana TaxID=62018 RepID=UPI003A7F1B47